ncbi:hypothetical protein LguiA_003361 [Lonicera macranthoides]
MDLNHAHSYENSIQQLEPHLLDDQSERPYGQSILLFTSTVHIYGGTVHNHCSQGFKQKPKEHNYHRLHNLGSSSHLIRNCGILVKPVSLLIDIEEEERMGIFQPFRAIGYITSSVPFSVQRLGTETFVTVSVGKSWQIYNESMQVRKGLFGVLCAFRCVLPLLLGWPGFGGVWMPGAARGREGNPVTTGIRGWSADQAMKMSGDMTT